MIRQLKIEALLEHLLAAQRNVGRMEGAHMLYQELVGPSELDNDQRKMLNRWQAKTEECKRKLLEELNHEKS